MDRPRLLMIGGWREVVVKAVEVAGEVTVIAAPERVGEVPRHPRIHTLVADIRCVPCCVGIAASLHRATPFTAAVSFTEDGLESAAAVVERLGVSGNPVRPVRATRDKLAMRELLASSSVPTVAYRRCRGPQDVEALRREVGGGVVVKPSKGAASAGVSLVGPDAGSGEVAVAWRAAEGVAGGGPVVAEEYVDGVEVSVDTMSYGGRHELVAVAEKVTTGPPHFVELGHQVPARLAPAVVARLEATVLRFLDLVGHRDGPAHTELKIESDRLVVIESQTRTGGDQIWELNRLATGYDMHRATLHHLLWGERIRMPRVERAAAVRFFSAPPGVVAAVRGRRRAAAAEGVRRLRLDPSAGGRVAQLRSSEARLGFVVCEGADVATAVGRAEAARAMIEIDVKPDEEEGAGGSEPHGAGGRRSDPLAGRLREALGRRAVLTGREACAPFDEEPTGRWRGRARCVLLPADTGEVAAALAICAEAGVGVVPQGGRTGLVGGSVAVDGEAVLSTARLGRLERVDRLSGQVTAGAGVTLADLQRHAAREGLLLPVDLAARDACTVGGMVATNAGGVHVLRWGPMRERVAGVEAALATGEVVSHLGGLLKDNTGYPLAQLLTGSEGTLGVVTQVRLRLAPLAAHRYTALLGHPDAAGALDTLVRLRERLPTLEATEIMWSDGVELVASAFEVRNPLAGAPVALLVESAAPEDHLDRFAAAIGDCPAVAESAVATDAGGRERLWRIRELHGEAVHRLGPPAKFDVTVPPAALAPFIEAVRPAVREVAREATVVLFGHAGDGNLHVNVVTERPDDPRLEDAVLGLVVAAGGSISAEHGIGRSKRRWLERSRSPGDLAAMRRIRRALDPAGIMNPGVL